MLNNELILMKSYPQLFTQLWLVLNTNVKSNNAHDL